MKRTTRLAVACGAAIATVLPLVAPPAGADYAPSGTDVVGVGSDTVQYAADFAADGDHLADIGYNGGGNLNKLINFDATPDANARLAYGSEGVGGGQCAPGEGGTVGTGNATATHADQPCTLNPTIVLRSGLTPTLRPNGSGAGGKAGRDDAAHHIDYVRASAPQGATLSSSGVQWDSITIGNDPLAMLTASTTNGVPLSANQLNLIYSCSATTWNDARIGGTSPNTIIPIVPQVGSGTRGSFLGAIGNPTLGACVKTAEENDPLAIRAQSSPADAIEPMSGGRLNLFLGTLGSGQSNGVGGYFQDPSCPPGSTAVPCADGTRTLAPAVTLVTSGTPGGSVGGPLFGISRPLYLYFRHADIADVAPFGTDKPLQPGGIRNLVRELFYNPCSPGQTGCVTIGTTQYGPGGKPFFATPAGQALVSAAGITPTYTYTANGPA